MVNIGGCTFLTKLLGDRGEWVVCWEYWFIDASSFVSDSFQLDKVVCIVRTISLTLMGFSAKQIPLIALPYELQIDRCLTFRLISLDHITYVLLKMYTIEIMLLLAHIISIHLVGLTSHYVTQRGKIAENTVYACALLSAHNDTHGTKGKKWTISRMSDQANGRSYIQGFNFVARSVNNQSWLFLLPSRFARTTDSRRTQAPYTATYYGIVSYGANTGVIRVLAE